MDQLFVCLPIAQNDEKNEIRMISYTHSYGNKTPTEKNLKFKQFTSLHF